MGRVTAERTIAISLSAMASEEAKSTLVLAGVHNHTCTTSISFSDLQTSFTLCGDLTTQFGNLRFQVRDALVFSNRLSLKLCQFNFVLGCQFTVLCAKFSSCCLITSFTRFGYCVLVIGFGRDQFRVQRIQIREGDDGIATRFHQIGQNFVFVFDYTQTQLGFSFTLGRGDLVFDISQLTLFKLNLFGQNNV
nr:MAG TPA_asm: hypothetical protein [Caudoviricetes sp.]